MRRATVDENKKCPKCGRIDEQVKVGFNDSGTQRCKCKICGIRYTLDPKRVIPKRLGKQLLKHFIQV